LSKGGNVFPPFGKGRWGGILTSLFQTAKLIPKMVWWPLKGITFLEALSWHLQGFPFHDHLLNVDGR
jgi:hypothetical protein